MIKNEEKKLVLDTQNLFPDNLVLCGYRGSYAQNTYIPNTNPNSVDDIDLMGVYLAPPEYYIGLAKDKFVWKDHVEKYSAAVVKFEGPFDVVSYELRKFVNLLLKSNPNVLSLLWIKDEHRLESVFGPYKQFGDMLIKNRDIFSSKIAYESFTGYAHDQLKKMTAYSKKGYMGEKRAKLVEKYGFDCKNSSHLIRLLRMGIEFLLKGELHIYRTHDADMLKEIKTGKWTLDEVKTEASKLFKIAENAYKNSTLPEEPNYEKAEEIVSTIIKSHILLSDTIERN